jgi:hypothetical protein
MEQTKIDWQNAPEWAKAHVHDRSGVGVYLEDPAAEPNENTGTWEFPVGRYDYSGYNAPVLHFGLWKATKQIRPGLAPKVDWNQLPESANFHAFDSDGIGWYYSKRPVKSSRGCWVSALDESYETFDSSPFVARSGCDNWADTLEERPKAKTREPIDPWENAPVWAEFHAFDRSGTGFYYQTRPKKGEGCWWRRDGANFTASGLNVLAPYEGWNRSLEERPAMPQQKTAPVRTETEADRAFDNDIPESDREALMTKIVDAGYCGGAEDVTITSQENLSIHFQDYEFTGTVQYNDAHYYFKVRDGSSHGTVLLEWERQDPEEKTRQDDIWAAIKAMC